MLTEAQLRCTPAEWVKLCRSQGWGRHQIPPEISRMRRTALNRKRIDRADNARKQITVLESVIGALRRENETLRRNLQYAVDEAAAAHESAIAARDELRKIGA